MAVLFFLSAILAPYFTPYDPADQNIDSLTLPPFSENHILGTDDLGCDLFTRILYGADFFIHRFFSVLIALFFGGLRGLVAGYSGGWADAIIMRILDIILSFPYILLAIFIVSALGPNLINAMTAIVVSNMPQYARLMRAAVLTEKEQDYVMVERSIGAQPPVLEWGLMIASSQEFISSAWWIVTFPGLATLPDAEKQMHGYPHQLSGGSGSASI